MNTLTLAHIDARRRRLGWSWAKLAREAGVSYFALYRGTASADVLAHAVAALVRAEENIAAPLGRPM